MGPDWLFGQGSVRKVDIGEADPLVSHRGGKQRGSGRKGVQFEINFYFDTRKPASVRETQLPGCLWLHVAVQTSGLLRPKTPSLSSYPILHILASFIDSVLFVTIYQAARK